MKDPFGIIQKAAVTVVVIGALFKLMHWPFAGSLLVLGLALFLAQAIRGMVTKTGHWMDRLLGLSESLLLLFALLGLAGAFRYFGFDSFRHWEVTKVLIMAVVLLRGYKTFRFGFTNKILRTVFGIGALTGAIGLLLYGFDQPYGLKLLLIGFSLALAVYFIDFFTMNFEEEDQTETKQ